MISALVAQDLTEILPSNPIARVVAIVIIVLFGWQSKGLIHAFREDRRVEASSEVDLLDMVEKITARRMDVMASDLEEERQQRRALERRVARLERRNLQLELYIESKELPLPDWPSHLKD